MIGMVVLGSVCLVYSYIAILNMGQKRLRHYLLAKRIGKELNFIGGDFFDNQKHPYLQLRIWGIIFILGLIFFYYVAFIIMITDSIDLKVLLIFIFSTLTAILISIQIGYNKNQKSIEKKIEETKINLEEAKKEKSTLKNK
jgi:hypothetical protein